MESNNNSPPNLDKYLVGREHHYMTYQDGAREYSLPYWGFVNLAKEAEANITLRKTAIVDMDKLEKYIEKNYADGDYPGKEANMPRGRKKIENIDELVKNGKKKYVRYTEGAQLYSMGLHTFQNLAKDANAIRKVKGVVLVNTEKIDAFIESFEEGGRY